MCVCIQVEIILGIQHYWHLNIMKALIGTAKFLIYAGFGGQTGARNCLQTVSLLLKLDA